MLFYGVNKILWLKAFNLVYLRTLTLSLLGIILYIVRYNLSNILTSFIKY